MSWIKYLFLLASFDIMVTLVISIQGTCDYIIATNKERLRKLKQGEKILSKRSQSRSPSKHTSEGSQRRSRTRSKSPPHHRRRSPPPKAYASPRRSHSPRRSMSPRRSRSPSRRHRTPPRRNHSPSRRRRGHSPRRRSHSPRRRSHSPPRRRSRSRSRSPPRRRHSPSRPTIYSVNIFIRPFTLRDCVHYCNSDVKFTLFAIAECGSYLR